MEIRIRTLRKCTKSQESIIIPGNCHHIWLQRTTNTHTHTHTVTHTHMHTHTHKKTHQQQRNRNSNSNNMYNCNNMYNISKSEKYIHEWHYHHHHLSLNHEGRWGTTDDFTTSFLHFSLFSTALWDLLNSRPVHSLMLSSHLFLCLPCLFPISLRLARWFWPDLMNGRYDNTTAVCVSLWLSWALRAVQLPAGSWHGLPRC